MLLRFAALTFAATAAATAAAPPAWHLTPDGWGPVKIGMTRPQVSRALRAKLKGEPLQDEETCLEMEAAGQPGLYFMFQQYQLTRISVVEPSRVTTSRNIGIGASASAVRRAYGRAIEVLPHHYEASPAEYLDIWIKPHKRGIRFETDRKRRVDAIHAGDDSIRLVEGCA